MKQVGMTWHGEAATKQEPLTEWPEANVCPIGHSGEAQICQERKFLKGCQECLVLKATWGRRVLEDVFHMDLEEGGVRSMRLGSADP